MPGELAYIALRAGGEKLASAWAPAGVESDAIEAAHVEARASLQPDREARVDLVEQCVPRTFRSVHDSPDPADLADVHRGVRGLELTHGEDRFLFSPTEMVARNLSLARVVERFLEARSLDAGALGREVEARTFGADQVALRLQPYPAAITLSRGASIVTPGEVTLDRVQAFVNDMGDWMTRTMSARGRLPYKYWPSRAAEAGGNNMVRQWMATVGLGRLAHARGDQHLFDLAKRNIEYNLASSYRYEDGLGVIECDGKVKLGAVALAALAIVQHPESSTYETVQSTLVRTIDRLWHADGSFETFLRPEGRADNQNFYPGEALLLWATLHERSPSDALLERIMASFRYYRAWHLAERNPAFVPWHTQAYCALWRSTGDSDLRDFVFLMNDWLLDMQQWSDAPYADLMGRFYDPLRPHFGGPHASSTGAYLESLMDAHLLARQSGDAVRAERYRLGVMRALRSLMQLQFRSWADMYYVSEPELVRGALRTNEYDNTVRLDNVQHALMAALKVLAAFEEDDYQCESHSQAGLDGPSAGADEPQPPARSAASGQGPSAGG